MDKFILNYFNTIRISIAISIGVAISLFLILIISKDPGASIGYLFLSPFLSRIRLESLISVAAPIIFCGIAIAIPFQAKIFNVGAEGALFIGAVAGVVFAIVTKMPPLIHIPLTLLVAGLAGGIWGLIPGSLKAKWNTSELVVSLMMNYVAYFLGLYIINYYFRDKAAGALVSLRISSSAWISTLPFFSRTSWSIVIALTFALLVYFLLYHTTLGYEIRTTGFNLHFAKFGGINVFKIIILAQIIGGFIAGVGGMTEIMAIHRRFNWQVSPGFGWDGVMVAIIGRNHPILIIFASLFLAYLRIGGHHLNLMSDVPYEMVSVIQSVIILLITAEAFLVQWKERITVKEAERKEIPHGTTS